MKFLIVGAGGVGGYFGARLAADGNDVTFIARGAHRRAMVETGLTVKSELGDLHIQSPQLYRDPTTTGLCDIILVCVKMWDTEAAGALIKPLLAHDSAVVSLQNGVEAEDLLAGNLGAEHVLGGVARIASVIEKPGVIRHTGTVARLIFGEFDGLPSWRQECLLSACIGAAIQAETCSDIKTELWRKFVMLAPLAGAACFHRCNVGELLAVDERRQLFNALVEETAALARARGAAFGPATEAQVIRSLEGFPPEMKPSMLHDLEAGHRLELEWLNGAVLRLGRAAGLKTPANAKVTEALEPYAGGMV
jgi:2-dehydropantoate 2-reductase